MILERALLHAVCLAIDAGIEGRGDRSAAPRIKTQMDNTKTIAFRMMSCPPQKGIPPRGVHGDDPQGYPPGLRVVPS